MQKVPWIVHKSAHFEGDILITDPCYLHLGAKDRDDIGWDPDETQSWIENNGGLYNRTYYGDWGCTVFKVDWDMLGKDKFNDAPVVGKFCADAGLVCVVPLVVVASRYPNIDKWHERSMECATILFNFSGRIDMVTRDVCYQLNNDQVWSKELRIRGNGTLGGKNILFESMQTSL